METPIPPIPERLKELRATRGFSLDELSERSGVSRAMLSKIERGAASPTIGLLCKITGALGVPLTRLVAEPEVARRRVITREEMHPLTDPVSGVTRTSLTTELPDWGVEVVRYEIPQGGSTGECGGCAAGMEEVFHVTRGELTLQGGGRSDTVRAGETLLFEGIGQGYELKNTGRGVTEFYIIIDRRGTNK